MNRNSSLKNDFIRGAEVGDASRLAEILVFSKRTHYRRIFHDDAFSFGELQVLPIARDLIERPETLREIRVFDDGFVKGLIHTVEDEIAELYVDPFFERQGIGSALMADALERILHPRLWVLEENENAVRFYRSQGFDLTGERVREPVPGDPVYKVRMVHRTPREDVFGKIVRVKVDRPLGSRHPKYPDLVYPVNYGYVPDVPGGDGEEQDVYILGVREALDEFTGPVTAVIRRKNDSEDKWVAAPEGMRFSPGEIREQTAFVERYFDSEIISPM